ncbi:hypothetical protein COW36_04275 [bacterium (Candidatus Blackallbacteria) CG17_big_fil_post_rev_8_21_14_2_50_48_46]|uniref:Uncharacterized protein n=1 Tax=bacterium (Candidatus Blackallbacteria) CG17_big_fil_post_rev_8_21_14_2_50_48_46 TaxID=2014261 RepID=A0A2M7G8U3_9BACT|nr:MAG: hypothetical protein COW64_04670 [bacterium (Candidatus Blackallbacteria) CG18_big_fil_WC_8_21_14_2_50_49_26]PIW18515.1 MAG: hypothetical protein COW36_04275 [bacterium (Candidatus Blackallbacteria) CG17_big_fil_post_rev_8_21_14_2_50_48_46]PIW46500.1 MAG: hypothetical protein COW20_16405 [bacterium (Candidatus Blackallbacteria) CG13_big_fil_rev_8_21_14_2_50_49_14]
MLTGDCQIILNRGTRADGNTHAVQILNANSFQASPMTEPREVLDKTGNTTTLYFTAEDASFYDQFYRTKKSEHETHAR